jgi:hypothetical protein
VVVLERRLLEADLRWLTSRALVNSGGRGYEFQQLTNTYI